jgi:excisionase family DNA binding protein
VQYFTTKGQLMSDMLTAKDVQDLLQVDRSTVYRMAEAGRLPAIKVGKQWRFPAVQIEEWMMTQMGTPLPPATVKPTIGQSPNKTPDSGDKGFANLLPLECVQLIQDSHADLLGVMLVITDMDGVPVTEPSRPCGLFTTINKQPDAVQRCISSWHDLGQALTMQPAFHISHLGLLCARGLIRVGTQLQGMVVAGCIAPAEWPPSVEEVEQMATQFSVLPSVIQAHVHEVFHLDEEQKAAVLSSVQQVANIVAHIVNEHQELVSRLEKIASLAAVK